jgi:1-acyl-sn-glycerol-3-phosphate acyltransferase
MVFKKWYFIAPFVLHSIFRPVIWILIRFFCNLNIKGLENLKEVKGKSFILASNHIHEFDPAFIPSAIPLWIMPPPTFFVSIDTKKYENLGWRKHIYGGLFFNAFGAYEASLGTKDYGVALKNHLEILRDGGVLYIFPEGKRSKTGEIGEARGGVAYLSHTAQCPVVPIAIQGIHFTMNLREFLSRKNHLTISIGKPIYPDSLFDQVSEDENKNIFQSAAQRIMQEIKQHVSS